jgi:uncharacterized protein
VILFIDTSAFVKLIVEEDGDDDVREWFSAARRAASSVITYAETSAALARRSRAEGAAADQLAGWVAALGECWNRTIALPVAEHTAGRLAITHGLRGMDAIQLSAALTLGERLHLGGVDEGIAFAAFDRRLLEAAGREGFATLGGPLE